VVKYNEGLSAASIGESVALKLSGGDAKRGDLLCEEAVKPVNSFSAHVFWASDNSLKPGDQIALECRTQVASCEPVELFDAVTSDPLRKIDAGEIGRVTFKVKEPILLDAGSVKEPFARVVFHRDGLLSGCGVVAEIDV
jgi:sulfate adenylyltransferase subunit 1 (EFTu-like GTPase family)